MVADSGLPDFAVEPWTGFFGPAGMAPELVKKLNLAVREVLALPEATKRLAAIGQFAKPSTPEEFKDYIRTEYTRWGQVVRTAGIPKA